MIKHTVTSCIQVIYHTMELYDSFCILILFLHKFHIYIVFRDLPKCLCIHLTFKYVFDILMICSNQSQIDILVLCITQVPNIRHLLKPESQATS